MRTTASGEYPPFDSSTDIVRAVDDLTHQGRLSNLLKVAQLIGLESPRSDADRRALAAAFRSYEGMLLQLDLESDREPLRRAISDAYPDCTPSEVDQLVRERLGDDL